ncbi:hypothetical protein [Providencia stuartii]|nr:hypothetical protein [Providencia stuartii]
MPNEKINSALPSNSAPLTIGPWVSFKELSLGETVISTENNFPEAI